MGSCYQNFCGKPKIFLTVFLFFFLLQFPKAIWAEIGNITKSAFQYDSNNDDDRDGLTNREEKMWDTDPAEWDSDKDLLPDGYEVMWNLNPLVPNDGYKDSDQDLIPDHVELTFYITNPWSKDSDKDELTDYEELFTYNTKPFIYDTDQDGIGDGFEVYSDNLDPNFPYDAEDDFDLDGLTNYQESIFCTKPDKKDSDRDGMSDEMEVLRGSLPSVFTNGGLVGKNYCSQVKVSVDPGSRLNIYVRIGEEYRLLISQPAGQATHVLPTGQFIYVANALIDSPEIPKIRVGKSSGRRYWKYVQDFYASHPQTSAWLQIKPGAALYIQANREGNSQEELYEGVRIYP